MFNLIKTQWIGIVAVVLVGFALLGTSVEGLGAIDTTTIGNPHTFTNTVTMSGATTLSGVTTLSGATTLSSTLGVTGATTLSGTLSYRELSEAVTASNTITASESGTIFYISGAASTSTLPAVATATGTVFTFVVATAVSGDITIVSAEGDNLEGAVDVNSSIVTVDAADRVLINQAAENLGDIVRVRSNGQKWFVTGEALNATGLSSDG